MLETAKLNRDSDIADWYYESITFRLAGRCRYTPDFLAVPRWTSQTWTFIETKGSYAREDSLIKLKVAAELYPCFRWLLVRRAGRHNWSVREITRTGIGTHDISIPWIGGGT